MASSSKCSAPEIHLLGEVVVLFGNLEFFLEISMWQLLALEDNQARFIMVQAITAEMSFKQKMQAFAGMFRAKGIARAEMELKELLGKLRSAEEKRNQIMHSTWNYSSIWGGQDLMRMKPYRDKKKGFRRGFHRMPVERIETIRNCIERANESLAQFTMKYIQPQP